MTTKAAAKLQDFEARARTARDKWLEENLKGTTVEKTVRELLKDRVQKVILETLGLREDGWGRMEWEIHRTNGRKPPIYQELDERARVAAIKMVTEALKTPPTLNKGQRDAIRKAYTDQLAWRARELAGDAGARDANEVLDRVLDETTEADMEFCPRCKVRHLEPLHDEEEAAAS